MKRLLFAGLILCGACGGSSLEGYQVRVSELTGGTCGARGEFRVDTLDPLEISNHVVGACAVLSRGPADGFAHLMCGDSDVVTNVPEDSVKARSAKCESTYALHISPIGVF